MLTIFYCFFFSLSPSFSRSPSSPPLDNINPYGDADGFEIEDESELDVDADGFEIEDESNLDADADEFLLNSDGDTDESDLKPMWVSAQPGSA